MELIKIQKEILTKAYRAEAYDSGIIPDSFDISSFIDRVFEDEGRELGRPLVYPLIQESRQEFDVQGYNNFLQSVKLDTDILLSFAKRTRILVRDLLVNNDVKSLQFQDRIRAVRNEISNFNSMTKDETPGIFTIGTKIAVKDTYPAFPETLSLELDSVYNSLTLPVNANASYDLDLKFLQASDVVVTPLNSFSDIVESRHISPFGNVSDNSSSPWIYNLTLRRLIDEATILVDFELPAIQEINKISFRPSLGSKLEYTLSTSSIGDNFIDIESETLNSADGIALLFKPRKVSKIRLRITAKYSTQESNESKFIFGLVNLKISRIVYNRQGSILFRDIDPGVFNRPIIDINLKSSGSFPDSTSTEYFIGLNDVTRNDPTFRTEDSDASRVNFTILQSLINTSADVFRNPFKTSNAVEFSRVALGEDESANLSTIDLSTPFTSITALSTDSRTFLSRATELWTEQNCFRTLQNREVRAIDVDNAIAVFAEDETGNVDIFVPFILESVFLIEDQSTDENYIHLPFPMASRNALAEAGIDTDYTFTNGVAVPTITISEVIDGVTTTSTLGLDRISIKSDLQRIYIDGDYGTDVAFKIEYLGLLDESVYVSNYSIKLRSDKDDLDSVISRADFFYGFNFKNNKLFKGQPVGDATPLAGVHYLSFEGIFTVNTLVTYTTYVTFGETVSTLRLNSPLSVNVSAGEYITLRNIDTGQLVSLHEDVISNLTSGDYLLTVLSRPKKRRFTEGVRDTTAIDNVLNATIVEDQNTSYKLFSDEAPIISNIGVRNKPLIYRELFSLLNATLRYGSNEFSSIIEDGELSLIIPESGYEILPISTHEKANLTVRYFNSNLFKDNVHTRLNLKIKMMDNRPSQGTLTTPVINDLEFNTRFI